MSTALSSNHPALADSTALDQSQGIASFNLSSNQLKRICCAGQSALDAFMEGAADPLAKASSSDRYGLEYRPTEPAFAPQIGDERGGKDDLTDGPGRRHLSAHERRLRKKPVSLPSPELPCKQS